MGNKPRILIVGQGLAGTVLHFSLKQRGISAMIMDGDLPGKSSSAAAGIINPITGPKYQKSWNYDILMDFFVPFYQDLETYIGKIVFHPMKMFRYLSNLEQINRWVYYADREHGVTCHGSFVKNLEEYLPKNEDGTWAEVLNAYRLDLDALFPAYREKLQEENLFIHESMDYSSIDEKDGLLTYQGKVYDLILFCEGFRVGENPYFNNLPIIPAKGEAILIKRKLDVHFMAKNNCMMTHWNDDLVWYGATLDNKATDIKPNEDSKRFLSENYKEDFGEEPKLEKLLSGIRPTSRDRRPVIGRNPKVTNMAILNGLGTKGTSLAPYSAALLVENILKDKEVPLELSVARFAI